MSLSSKYTDFANESIHFWYKVFTFYTEKLNADFENIKTKIKKKSKSVCGFTV